MPLVFAGAMSFSGFGLLFIPLFSPHKSLRSEHRRLASSSPPVSMLPGHFPSFSLPQPPSLPEQPTPISTELPSTASHCPNVTPNPPLPKLVNKDWEQAAESDPALRARRRAYDCEILVLRHRMGCDGANGATLAAAFRRLRARAARQRRARDHVAVAAARRDAALVRSAFDALARGSRSRAAAAAAAAARCRAGLATWRRAAAVARGVRALCWQRERAIAMCGLRRWRQRSVDGQGGGRQGAEGREALEWRLEVFRERRAKRLVFRAWRGAAQTAAVVAVAVLEGGAGGGVEWSRDRGHREGRRWRGFPSHVAASPPGWGARLRTAEVRREQKRTEIVSLAYRQCGGGGGGRKRLLGLRSCVLRACSLPEISDI